MLSKKFLLKQFTQRLIKSFALTPKKPALSNYLKHVNFSSTSEPANQTIQDTILDEPKWMRFFKGMEPNPIDLERAVKNDNVDLLNNYVKMNYIGFDFFQLVVVMGSLTKIHSTSSRVFTEIKVRVTAGKYDSNKKIMFQLLTGAREYILQDDMMKKFTILEVDKYFDQYTHKEQSEIILFMFEADSVKSSRILQYLSHYEPIVQEGKISEYFESLSPEEVSLELKVFDTLAKNLVPEGFEKLVNRQLLDSLANKVNCFLFVN